MGLRLVERAKLAYLIVCKMATAEEFKMASKRLAEEIARTRDKPIGFEKLF